ncbi:hypothetical protein [Kitasatospora sp. NPDC002040]|uniref:hypothetical protein n=1 Tax=Kitasatospora sp. NPDC002040 TaxID=3154661 RepID=UPI0033261873
MGNTISGGEFEHVIQADTVNLTNSRRHPTPSGLPPRSLFVGREALLTELLTAPGTCLLAGLGGIGKTALAVEAAHRLRDRYPGGTLFVDLHGYDSARLSPEQALDALLPALTDLPTPPGLGAKQQLYRSLLATHEPVLIVADNAATPDQVTPLLPNDPRHRVLVTSRHLLTDRTLTPRHFVVDVLPESVPLLTELAGPSEHHPALAELCGHLPLALRIAAALLTERSPEELVEDLTDAQERLTELDYGPDLAVRTAFDLSYRRLPEAEARLFALLGHNLGPDIGLPAAAALVDLPPREAARLLRSLTRAHLVIAEHGRYRLHDLVKLFAAELALDDTEPALRRLLDHYCNVAAHIQTGPGDWRSAQWLAEEDHNLVAALLLAGGTDQGESIPTLLRALHDRLDQLTLSLAINELGPAVRTLLLWCAVRQAFPDRPEVWAQLDEMWSLPAHFTEPLSGYQRMTDRDPVLDTSRWAALHREAVTRVVSHGRALYEIAQQARDGDGTPMTTQLDRALDELLRLEDVGRTIGAPQFQGIVLQYQAECRLLLGQQELAAAALERAVAAFETVSDDRRLTQARGRLADLVK